MRPFRPFAEGHLTVGQREQRVIAAHADIGAGPPGGAALTHDDVAGNGRLAAKQLDAKTATGRIATVAGRTACFLCAMGQSPYSLAASAGAAAWLSPVSRGRPRPCGAGADGGLHAGLVGAFFHKLGHAQQRQLLAVATVRWRAALRRRLT